MTLGKSQTGGAIALVSFKAVRVLSPKREGDHADQDRDDIEVVKK